MVQSGVNTTRPSATGDVAGRWPCRQVFEWQLRTKATRNDADVVKRHVKKIYSDDVTNTQKHFS